jgi:hypothetical protein
MLLLRRGSHRKDASRVRGGRLSYERVVVTLALFLTLAGGSAVAASKLITGKDIAKGTITGRNIRSHSLLSLDFKSGQLPRGATGPRGAPGPSGATGSQGTTGAPGAKGDTGSQGPAGTAAASGTVEVDATSGNAEWQPGTNSGFPSSPIRKAAGVYCIPLPAGVDGETVAPILTPTGTPSIDVAVTPTDCANTTNWVEVDVYGPITLSGISPQTYGIQAAPQDFPFDVALP